MRLTNEELNKVKLKYNVNELWSFSKFDAYRNSHYEWMLKYIKCLTPNNEKISAYASLGGICHDMIEKYYNGEVEKDNMAEEFSDTFTTLVDVAGLFFDRNDSTKNQNIKNKYYDDIYHFYSNFKPFEFKPAMERFIAIKITDDIVFQGYADAIYKDNNGIFTIVDFKTSTRYSASSLIDHQAQLCLYAEGLRQMGIPKENIRVCFDFLKYVDVDCEQVNGKIKTRSIERYELGSALQSNVKIWLKKLGYEDSMVEYLDGMLQTNSIDGLPDDVKSKFVIKEAFTYIDDIWGFYNNTLKPEIIKTVEEIRANVKKYNELKDIDIDAAEHLFWDDEDTCKAQSYYFNNLSEYNTPTLKPYKAYLDKITAEKNDNILGTSGMKSEFHSDDEDDMSWLQNLL